MGFVGDFEDGARGCREDLVGSGPHPRPPSFLGTRLPIQKRDGEGRGSVIQAVVTLEGEAFDDELFIDFGILTETLGEDVEGEVEGVGKGDEHGCQVIW